MRETSKLYGYRVSNGIFANYLNGNGIDVCPQENDDLVTPNPNDRIIHFKYPMEHALYINKYQDNMFNFVYASHVLPEMIRPDVAVRNWIRICKPNRYIFITVPIESKYYQGVWPCRWNASHKWSFSLSSPTTMPKNIVVSDFLNQFLDKVVIVNSYELELNWDPNLPRGLNPKAAPDRVDQTYDYEDLVVLNIEMILRKL